MLRFSLIVLKTAQLPDLHYFYALLGFKFLQHRHGNGPEHYASDTAGVVLELYPLPQSEKEADTTTRLGLMVSNLDELIQRPGIKVISAPKYTEWGYTAVVQDPDGRRVELTQVD